MAKVKDDVVIIKVENGRIVRRENGINDTVSQSRPRKKRKLLTSLPSTSSSTDVSFSDNSDGTRQANVSDYDSVICLTGESDNESKSEARASQSRPPAVNGITETVTVEENDVLTEDAALIEQQMIDHALALSLEQEEIEKLSRNNNSNDREYPVTTNTSSSRVYPSCSQPVTGDAGAVSLLSANKDCEKEKLLSSNCVDSTDKEFELPKYWQPMPENCSKNYELFMVLPGTEEYNMVTQQFLHQPLSVYSVKRIQNLEFLKRYTLEKKLILSVRGKDFNLNEQRLFHTSAANPDDICEQGLDNRLSRFGGCFGTGIYFRYRD